jgi:hypothetical protein
MPPIREYVTDDACHTAFPDNAACSDPDYSWEAYVQNKTPRKCGVKCGCLPNPDEPESKI